MKSVEYTFRLIWGNKRIVVPMMVLVVLNTAARLGQPYLYKSIVDVLTSGLMVKGFSQVQVGTLIWGMVIWFALALSNMLLSAQLNYLGWRLGQLTSATVHMDGFRRLLRLDYSEHTRKHSSQYAKIVDEADTAVWELTNFWTRRIIPSLLGFAGMLVVAFSVNWKMTLVSLLVIPPGLAVIVFMVKKYEDEQHKINKLWNRKHEHLSDQVANIVTYKLNQNEKIFVAEQKTYNDKAVESQHFLNKKWRLTEMLNPDVLARFLVLAMGTFMVVSGEITVGTMFMFAGLMSEILLPLHFLGDFLPQYSRKARYVDKYLELCRKEDKVVDPKRPVKIVPSQVKGRIEFKNVSFGYETGVAEEDAAGRESEDSDAEEGSPGELKAQCRLVIKDLSFVIEPGQHIALVGHSGAGKSTLMALLTRLSDPTSGEILLDGVNIKKFRQEDYRRLIGVVLQEHSLYNETIAQNIAYGKPGALRREIVAAAKKAAADEFISKLPKGYDTRIGERGVRLSGGEKQRLAIARAILKNPKIVVLDEPTSALDSITEARVQKGLVTLIEGRSSLVIAHRLSTVRNADRILVLGDQKLIAEGTHLELLRACPEYREMVELQTGGFLEE